MQRYITAILAIVIAIGMAAFTNPVKNLDMLTFIYSPQNPGDYSQQSVQDKSNWIPGTASCSDDLDKACSLQVPLEETTNSGTELGPDVTITSEEGGDANAFYVTGGANVSDIHNKD